MQDLMYVIFFIIFAYPIRIQAVGVFYANEYELYGSTLAANDQWIIAIQNRTGITFSAVSNYFSSPQFCSVTYNPTTYSDPFATMLAVGRIGSPPNNNGKFVFVVYSNANQAIYLYSASVTFPSCQLTILNQVTMLNTIYPQYSVLAVNTISTMVIYLSDQNITIQNLIAPYAASNWSPFQISPATLNLLPVGIDLKDMWGILGTYVLQTTHRQDANRMFIWSVLQIALLI
jgi:hypothetical protein